MLTNFLILSSKDAVVITLYTVVINIIGIFVDKQDLTVAGAVWFGIAKFTVVFFGGAFVGFLVGFVNALVTKYFTKYARGKYTDRMKVVQ